MAKPTRTRQVAQVVAEVPLLQVSARLPEAVWKWVRIEAINQNRNAAAILESAIEQYRGGLEAGKVGRA
jgi:hypothetical protein